MRKQVVAAVLAVVLASAGVVVLVSYAQGADERAMAGTKLRTVLQVQSRVPANTSASAVGAHVKTVRMPASTVPRGALKDLKQVSGLVTTATLEPGERVLRARFASPASDKPKAVSKTDVPKGMQEVTVPLGPARAVGGQLVVGDIVGVVGSFPDPDQTGVVRHRVRVTRIAKSKVQMDEGSGDESAGHTLVTLAVPTVDAEKIINAAEFGKVWLTKQNASTTLGGRTITRKDIVK